MQDLFGISLRVLIIYVYALLLLRLSGKRSIAHLTALDFIVALAIGDMFDDVIWSEIPLAQGLVGVTTIVLLHTLVAFASWKSRRIHVLVASSPTRLLLNGKLLTGSLTQERMSAAEVEMGLRLLGEDKLDEIHAACL